MIGPARRRGRGLSWATGVVGVVALAMWAAVPAATGATNAREIPVLANSEIGDDGTEFCVGPMLVQGVEAEVCEFPLNWTFDVPDSYAAEGVGVVIQAVGGAGGAGGSVAGGTVGGGGGGTGGLAQATFDASDLAGETLYMYVGNNGGDGADEKGGSAGAATVVATAAVDPSATAVDDSILVVAGGGGGGEGYDGSSSDLSSDGGDGGVAITVDVAPSYGFGEDGSPTPYTGTPDNDDTGLLYGKVLDIGVAGRAPTYDDGAWTGGAAGGSGKAGSADFTIAGAAGSKGDTTWVRETSQLTLGSSDASGGSGSDAGGAGGAGVAGGGGSEKGGGAGGASYSVGSGGFDVPCTSSDPSVLCLDNWLSTADDDEPSVVVTFFQDTSASATTPADGSTIDSDQPLLTYSGSTASGVLFDLSSDDATSVETATLTSPGTGAPSWSPPWGGMLEVGATYTWSVTNLDGKQLQDPQTFTVGDSDGSSGNGWQLFLRSMDCEDTDLDESMQPLGTDGCTATCDGTNAGCQPWPTKEEWKVVPDSDCPSPSTATDCTSYDYKLDNPTSSTYWVWDLDTDSGSYANLSTVGATIDFDWSADTNPISNIFPSALIGLTSEDVDATDDPDDATTHVLSVPIDGDYTFTSETNGGMRFSIWSDTSGTQSDTATTALDAWSISSCKYSDINAETISESEAKVYAEESCQNSTDVVESSTFTLQAGVDYRVQIDGVVSYLPGPMTLGYTYGGSTWSAPLPANWITRCTWDDETDACSVGLSSPEPSTTTTSTTSSVAPTSTSTTTTTTTTSTTTTAAVVGVEPTRPPAARPVAATPTYTG